MTDRRTQAQAVVWSLLMVTSMFVGVVALAGVASTTSSAQAATIADANPGTVFEQLLVGGNPDESVPIGLIKRGESGGLLYNPSQDLVVLNPGDVVVNRNGAQFEVTEQQNLQGSTGFVGPGATLFQGEEQTDAVGFNTDQLVGLPNLGAEGETLDLNQTVPVDQETGVYADEAGNRLTVQSPRVSRLNLLNSNGQQLQEGGNIRNDEFMIVQADINFLPAERAEMNLIDPATGATLRNGILNKSEALQKFPDRANVINANVPDGATEQVSPDPSDRSLVNPQTPVSGTIYMIYDMSQVTKTGGYIMQIQSEDDDPFRDLLKVPVRREFDFNLESSDQAQLNFQLPDLTTVQGEFVDYQIERSFIGQWHVVSIGGDGLRGGGLEGNVSVSNATQVFREAGDGGQFGGVLLNDGTVILNDGRRFENGNFTGNTTAFVNGTDVNQVFTLVQIKNNGIGTNQIDSAFLDDTNVNVNLYRGSPSIAQAAENYEQSDGTDFINQVTIRVFQGGETLAVTAPGQTYVAGDDVDVSGTADPAIDFVSVYARSAGETWQLVEPSLSKISVRADGTWSRPNVVLSTESDVLSVPGQFRIGIIDSFDADIDGNGQPDPVLSNSEFTRGASSQRGIQVINQDLTGGFTTYNGQVAVEDGTVRANGTNAGGQQVLYVFVGSRGNNIVQSDAVSQNWEYRNRNVPLFDQDGPLQQGSTVSLVLSPARDGVFGGSLGTRTPNQFVSFVNGLQEEGLTQNQTVQRILEASVDDQGSDDLDIVQQWEFTRAATTVNDVIPSRDPSLTGIREIQPGDTMLVRGVTNLRADDNAIVLDMQSGPDARLFDVYQAGEWNTTGRWTAEIQVPEGARPGTYTLRTDDGENIITTQFQIVEQAQQPTPTATESPGTPSGNETATPTAAPATPTATATPAGGTPTQPTTPAPTTTTGGGPGFTVVLALAALLMGAALLAARRRR